MERLGVLFFIINENIRQEWLHETIPVNYFPPFPNIKYSIRWNIIMSEAIIVKRGRSGGDTPGLVQTLITNIITSNTTFQAPNAINNTFYVRIFGGGGAGNASSGGGGGSGWMNNGEIVLNYGTSVSIRIGRGGSYNNGGTTTFGTYLSANGGGVPTANKAGCGGAGGSASSTVLAYGNSLDGGDGYQFGGGSGALNGNGGNGGIWGGGGAGGGGIKYYPYTNRAQIKSDVWDSKGGNGGHGGTYGGGGGACVRYEFTGTINSSCVNFGGNIANRRGGNGGTYGGGGGGGIAGTGGTYGGNGGTYTENSENGTNTATWTNVYHDGNTYFRGYGKAGVAKWGINNTANYNGGGGGGYGGNGGNSKNESIGTNDYAVYGGGGGGYGGNGGSANSDIGGGGGGYGGSGGTGGGGGYGTTANGGGDYRGYGGGGGGYYTAGSASTYDGGAPGTAYSEWGRGGFGGANLNGTSGVCIIQYYIWSME